MSKAVKMTERVAGGWHDGEQWREYPPIGETVVLEDAHADHEVAAGRAEYVKAETRAAETRNGNQRRSRKSIWTGGGSR